MNENKTLYVVYVTINTDSYITAINSSAFLSDPDGWIEIDSGYDRKHAHSQCNYFDKPIMTMGGAYRYKLVDGKVVECTPEEIKTQEEANKLVPVEPDGSVWDELDAAYQEGVDSV